MIQIRLEKAKDSTEIPQQIAFDNLKCRDKRYGADLTRDIVEIQLLKVTNKDVN